MSLLQHLYVPRWDNHVWYSQGGASRNRKHTLQTYIKLCTQLFECLQLKHYMNSDH